MTVLDVIEAVDCRLHNEVCEEAKIKWISDLDRKIQRDIIDTHEDGENHTFPYDLNSEVIIEEAYNEIYILYLLRQITLLNGEIEHSNNYLSEYNNLIYEWKKFYNREHLPLPVGKIRNYRYEG